MGTSRAIIIAGAPIAAAVTATVIDSPRAPETVAPAHAGPMCALKRSGRSGACKAAACQPP